MIRARCRVAESSGVPSHCIIVRELQRTDHHQVANAIILEYEAEGWCEAD